MALNNVPRIAAPAPDVFFQEYVCAARPVVLTALFAEQPIGQVDTVDKACDALGDVALEIQPNYMTFLESGHRGERRISSLSTYIDHARAMPDTRDLCVEYDTPESLRHFFPRPDYCRLRDESDVVSATFVANGGNFNHLHFDDDQRDVLLYQVFGVKRFVIIAPEQGRKLDPFLCFDPRMAAAAAETRSRDANGRVFLESFPSEAARDGFLRYVQASETLLHPGETIYIPALHWHYVEYLDLSMSLTYRLGRNKYNRALSRAFPAPDVFVQSVGARLSNEEEALARHGTLVGELYDACCRSADDGDSVDAAHDLVGRLFEAMYGESAVAVAISRELYRVATLTSAASRAANSSDR